MCLQHTPQLKLEELGKSESTYIQYSYCCTVRNRNRKIFYMAFIQEYSFFYNFLEDNGIFPHGFQIGLLQFGHHASYRF